MQLCLHNVRPRRHVRCSGDICRSDKADRDWLFRHGVYETIGFGLGDCSCQCDGSKLRDRDFSGGFFAGRVSVWGGLTGGGDSGSCAGLVFVKSSVIGGIFFFSLSVLVISLV